MKKYKVYLVSNQIIEVDADKQVGRGKFIYMYVEGVLVAVFNAEHVAAILTVLPS
jgi:hypothetical protein